MTNRNILSKPEPHRPAPLFLRPTGKDYLWGGRRLNDDFTKGIDMDPLAETWECSTHPDGLSIVASGEFEGQTLAAVLEDLTLNSAVSSPADAPLWLKRR